MIALIISFLVTAFLYAAVGFGGGSTYNALLVMAGTDYRILPAISLICNLIVVSSGSYRYYRAGHIDIVRIMPWVITSVPAAWIGGYIDIPERLFIGLLGFSLLLAAIRMIWDSRAARYKKGGCTNITNIDEENNRKKYLPLILGAALGLLAGMVGIGGGIFLAPVLYLLHWDNAKKIAATCSVFILVNSLAGLSGQIIKLWGMDLPDTQSLFNYWALFPAVFIGAQFGSILGANHLNLQAVRLMTACLILYVSLGLLWRWWEMIL